MKFTEIKTFDDACKALEYDASIPQLGNAPAKHKKALEAHYKLVIITEAINEGWQPDWADHNQPKYELWPDIIEDDNKPSGFGLSSYVCGYWYSHTTVGSRLCFQSREKARHCFETFKQLWEDYFLIEK